MSLSITAPADLLDDRLRQFAERRFQFALSRFDSRINAAEVTVSRQPTENEFSQHECQVKVTIQRASDVTLTEQDTELTRCISRAAERVGRAVGRSIKRSQNRGRFQAAAVNANTVS